jgi:hypothetical protein
MGVEALARPRLKISFCDSGSIAGKHICRKMKSAPMLRAQTHCNVGDDFKNLKEKNPVKPASRNLSILLHHQLQSYLLFLSLTLDCGLLNFPINPSPKFCLALFPSPLLVSLSSEISVPRITRLHSRNPFLLQAFRLLLQQFLKQRLENLNISLRRDHYLALTLISGCIQ